ncbi:triose-phosphate transporter family domain-containing protein [Ditylenchus destructor]|nr:triose-phosphate transporter family domain-containing protein [Ditylenchus destructor]
MAISSALRQQYIVIVAAVSSYWICSISLVFLNKYLLSSPDLKLDAPLFITCYQCFFSVVLCFACAQVSSSFPTLMTFPKMTFDQKLSREVLPLSFIFVAMVTFNNLCLKNVGVSFYYVGRSLTTVFNVICSYLILGQTTSAKALVCCGTIVLGFFLGVDQEDAAGSLSISGVIYGVLASLCVALNAIYTKKTLPIMGDSIWRLTMYNNLNACFLFLPLMLFTGEFGSIPYFDHLFSAYFWAMMSLSGFFGFIMGYVTGWQIQATSALTHNISGTAKAAAQTVMAVIMWSEIKSALWWLSNIVVLFGSGLYTYVQKQDLDKKFSRTPNHSEDKTATKSLIDVESQENSDERQ